MYSKKELKNFLIYLKNFIENLKNKNFNDLNVHLIKLHYYSEQFFIKNELIYKKSPEQLSKLKKEFDLFLKTISKFQKNIISGKQELYELINFLESWMELNKKYLK